MEDSLKLIQLRCANCGAMLSRADKFDSQIKCPYCATVNEVTGTMQRDIAAPERVIAFKSSDKDFERQICDYFLDDDYAVNDIFEKVEMDNTTAVFLPMFLFEGKFEANYNCSVGYQETQLSTGTNLSGERTIKEKTVTKWRPLSGTAKGNYAFLSLAFEGDEIIPELAEWTRTFPYDPVSAQPFKMDIISGQGCQILPHNLDRETTWHKWGTSTIEYQAKNEAENQLPQGEKIKDFRTTFSYDPKHDGRMFLVPFWFVYYNYNTQKHFVLMDGLGRNIHGSIPQDFARINEVNKLQKLGKWGLWIGIALALLVTIIPIDGSFVVGLFLGLGAWLGLKFWTKSKVKGIFAAAREIRKAGHDRVTGSA